MRLPITLRLVDVAESARRLYGLDEAADMFPGLPEHDYRFEVVLPNGAEITLQRGATAAHVAAYLAREGVDPGAPPTEGGPR